MKSLLTLVLCILTSNAWNWKKVSLTLTIKVAETNHFKIQGPISWKKNWMLLLPSYKHNFKNIFSILQLILDGSIPTKAFCKISQKSLNRMTTTDPKISHTRRERVALPTNIFEAPSPKQTQIWLRSFIV